MQEEHINEKNRTIVAAEEKETDIMSVLMDYLIYWPWILAGTIVALVLCTIYLKYKAPVYNVNASVLIQNEEKRRGGSSSMLENMQMMGVFSMGSGVYNEIELLNSRNLIKRVVENQNLYIRYAKERRFGYDIDLYGKSPVKVWMTPQEADNLCAPVKLDFTRHADGQLDVKVTYVTEKNGDEVDTLLHIASLPALVNIPVGIVSLDRGLDDEQIAANPELEAEYKFKAAIVSPTSVGKGYQAALAIATINKNSEVVGIDLKETNPARGCNFVNTLINLYNSDANDYKNEVASKTAQFINDRIKIINKELSSTEVELADYKQKAGLTNLQSDAQLALQENSAYNKQYAENATQIRLIQFLKEYIHNPAKEWEVLPANVGYTDASLNSLIDKYNQLLVERNRLLQTSSESNPAVKTLDASVQATRVSVITTVESVEKGLLITQNDLKRHVAQFEERISSAPQQERQLGSIARQQEIQSSIYLILLQKREENSITLAATATTGRVVNTPEVGSAPIAPRKMVFYLVALILGAGLPVGFVYLRKLTRLNIETSGDIEKITSVPIVGDIPKSDKVKNGAIVISENKNDMMEEVFRNVRTNLQFMLKAGEKVIMFTSTISGEGKSFIAGNLATSFAFMGKKVVVVGLDIRKPGLNRVFKLAQKEKGITQYLSDPTVDLLSLCQQSLVSPNLYILPGGSIPPNPTELVARRALDDAIEILKDSFDYVILDTAPIGMVTDSLLIARVADLGVYVCRSNYTRKREYERMIKKLEIEKKFPSLCTIINGIDMNSRSSGSYYGYGKYGKYGKYGYGKKYGYGYGYGYGQEHQQNKK